MIGRRQGGLSLGALSTQGSEQDTTFLELLKARDNTRALVDELKRIKSYHDKLTTGVKALFDSAPRSFRSAHMTEISEELIRLDNFEGEINGSPDTKAKIDLVIKFDREFYPLTLSDSQSDSQFDRAALRNRSTDPVSLVSLRAKLAEVFQNVSLENRQQFFDRYDKVLTDSESLGKENANARLLDNLPPQFFTLASAASFDLLTEAPIKSAITKYRDVLKKTLESITQSPEPEPLEVVKTRLMGQLVTLDTELQKKMTQLTSQTEGLQNGMISSAKSVYGKTIGAESFNYLLIVFAGVFVVIMAAPKLYPNTAVAENVLKSEFLLQFSTVFVLVAAIIILAIGNFIAKDQLPVLLAGISGYVLGQLGVTPGGAVPARSPPLNDGPSKSGSHQQA